MIPMKVEMEMLKVKHIYMGFSQTPARSKHHGLNVGLQHKVGW